MNISECRQVLSYIYSTHPNAPSLSSEDKTRMVAAYFRVLYKFTLNDIMYAIDRIGKTKPSFIPTAYEIEEAVTPTLDINLYLTDEYWKLDRELYQYKAENIYSKQSDLRVKYRLSTDVDEKEKIKAEFEQCERLIYIKARCAELYKQAEIKALCAYNDACEKESGLKEIEHEMHKEIR